MKNITLLWIVLISSCTMCQQNITGVDLLRDSLGTYVIQLSINNNLPADVVLEKNNYKLYDIDENELKLSEPVLWRGKGVKFFGTNISRKGEYKILFRDEAVEINEAHFDSLIKRDRITEEKLDEFEQLKGFSWEWSAVPGLQQSDSSRNSIGDLALNFFLRSKLQQNLDFNLEGNISSNKNDPVNFVKFNTFWRPFQIAYGKDFRYGIRPVSLGIEEITTQEFNFHDFSGRIYSTVFIHPFKGVQPLFFTAGYDHAFRKAKRGDTFNDGRIHLQAQWGFAGLAGKGSGFFIEVQYWNRILDDLKINPLDKKVRTFVQLKFVTRVFDDKLLKLTYARGDMAPTFSNTTSVSLGLEILVNGIKISEPE